MTLNSNIDTKHNTGKKKALESKFHCTYTEQKNEVIQFHGRANDRFTDSVWLW